ncbi:MAG: hypothetical protein IPG87_01505 [Saprospiraceae bacterium]|nr:hypothetical protein [Candidatus Vicinibacter affinis]
MNQIKALKEHLLSLNGCSAAPHFEKLPTGLRKEYLPAWMKIGISFV